MSEIIGGMRFPYETISSNTDFEAGCLVSLCEDASSSSFFSHPFTGRPGTDLPGYCGPFLYLKTIEYGYDTEDDNPKDYRYDVVIWNDRLIEINIGRLERYSLTE